jgi:3-dehydroquinate dehydratase-1
VKKPKPVIIGVITEDNFDDVMRDLDPAESEKGPVMACNVLEFRADTFSESRMEKNLLELRQRLLRQSKKEKKLLFTLRLGNDGGKWEKSSDLRNSVFEKVIQRRLADWIDLEIEEVSKISPQLIKEVKQQTLKLVISHHNFNASYSEKEFDELTDKMAKWNPDIVKFAVTVHTFGELKNLLESSKKLSKRFPLSCLISMGKFGGQSRICSPIIGAPLTYGHIGKQSVVDGQIEVRELNRRVIRMMKHYHPALSGQQLLELLEAGPNA